MTCHRFNVTIMSCRHAASDKKHGLQPTSAGNYIIREALEPTILAKSPWDTQEKHTQN